MEQRHKFVSGKVAGMCYCDTCRKSRHDQQEAKRVANFTAKLLREEPKVNEEFASMLSGMEQRNAKTEAKLAKKRAKAKAKRARNRANKAKRREEERIQQEATAVANAKLVEAAEEAKQRRRKAKVEGRGLTTMGQQLAQLLGYVPDGRLADGRPAKLVPTKEGAKNPTKRVAVSEEEKLK